MTRSKDFNSGERTSAIIGGGAGGLTGARLGSDLVLLGPDGTRNTVRYANMNVARSKPKNWTAASRVVTRTPGVNRGLAGGILGAAGLGTAGVIGGKATYKHVNRAWRKKEKVDKGLSPNQIKGLQGVLAAGKGGPNQAYAFSRLMTNNAGKQASREISRLGIAGKPEVAHHIGTGQHLSEGSKWGLNQINADTRIARQQRIGTNVTPLRRKRRGSKTIVVPVNKALKDKVHEARDKDISGKAVAAGAVGAALALKGGHNAALYAQASRNRRLLANPVRAARLAETLNSKGSRSIHDVNLKDPKQLRKPLNHKAHNAARAENGDVKRLTRPVNDWSRNMRNVRRYRAELDNPKKPSLVRAVVDPKARYWHQARTLQQVQQHAPKTKAPLYRATDLAPGQDLRPGAGMNTGRLSSWTSDQKVADMFTDKQVTRGKLHRTVSANPMKWKKHRSKAAAPKGSTPALLRMPEGSAGSLHIGPASRHFGQSEWLSGGKVRIKAVSDDPKYKRKVIDLEEVGKRSDEYGGVDHINPTKFKPLNQEEIDARKRRQALTSTATGTLGLAALTGTALASRHGQKALRAGFARAGKKVPRDLMSKPKDRGLDRTITPMLATSAGIGSIGAFNFASYTRAEAEQKKVKKNMTTSAFGVEHTEVSKGFGSALSSGAKKLGQAFGHSKPTKPTPVTPAKHSYATNDTPLFGAGPKAAAPKHRGMANISNKDEALPGMPKPAGKPEGGSKNPFNLKSGAAIGAAAGAGTYAGYQAKKHNQGKQLKQYR